MLSSRGAGSSELFLDVDEALLENRVGPMSSFPNFRTAFLDGPPHSLSLSVTAASGVQEPVNSPSCSLRPSRQAGLARIAYLQKYFASHACMAQHKHHPLADRFH
ncbi:hypothetical protein ONS96_004121 [Cadophora gregata f. sp. sojae]|nr:hypothetical protein ONS96_004121 [Cadophora gregata f. sp. sojae]